MNELYVMDACALIAFLRNETGAEVVTTVLRNASERKASIRMNGINLLEVYYDVYRMVGSEEAHEKLLMIKKLPITIYHELSDKVFLEAGRLKASYKISLADSIALAETLVSGGLLLTADHHEFDEIEMREQIKFRWIR